MRKLQRYLAILLFALFSLIAAGEITHHHNAVDAHCYSQHDRHIHTEIHHCSFCDFTFSPLDARSSNLTLSSVAIGSDIRFIFKSYSVTRLAANTCFLRGPPHLA